MEPELLVKELLKNHQKDRNLTGDKVQEEVKKLREKYNKTVKELKDDEQLMGLDWTNADLEEYDLTNLKLSDYKRKANFTNANLKLSALSGSFLKNANFTNAELQGISMQGPETNLKGANLSKARLAQANLNGINLRGALLINSDLAQANLVGVDLSEAILKEANLWKTDFRGANLFHVDFSNTNLDDTDFRYANLYRARFTGSNVQEAILSSHIIRKLDIHEIKESEISYIIQDFKDEEISRETLTNIYKKLNKIILDKDRYYKANKIYREQKIVLNQNGYHDYASDFHYREADSFFRSLKGLRKIPRKLIYFLFKYLAGYGELWWRPLLWILGFITFFGLIFWYFNAIVEGCFNSSLEFLDYMYFSVVTFTTLGFGDLQPKNTYLNLGKIDIPIFRIAAASEALIGAMLLALFIAVLARRILR